MGSWTQRLGGGGGGAKRVGEGRIRSRLVFTNWLFGAFDFKILMDDQRMRL